MITPLKGDHFNSTSIPDITISIINTNNRDITLQCLNSVYKTAGNLDIQVIVVNNACKDNSKEAILEVFPEVLLLENQTLLGFSTNNNLALSHALGRYWLLLNDDTIVLPFALQNMVEFMDSHPEAGVVGAALLNSDGTAQYCYDFLPNPLYEGLRPFSEIFFPPPSSSQPFETGYVCGACLMVRAEAARIVGPLDTIFDPLYSEEVDWCFRFKKKGWKVFHLPQANVVHLGEVSRRSSDVNRYLRIYSKKTVYFRKHFGNFSARLYNTILGLNNLIKAVIWMFFWLFRRPDARREFELHWMIFIKSFYF